MSSKPHVATCPFCRGLHWHKYQYLELKLQTISRYTTIDKKNFASWGEEIADLLVLTGNEMDTFFRDMYDCPNFHTDSIFLSVSKEKEDWDIKEYRKVFEPYYLLSENKISIGYGLGLKSDITPFSKFSKRQPSWWRAYNKIKHEHYDHLRKGNLRNLLNILGGLLILNALHFCSSYYLAVIGKIGSFYMGTNYANPRYHLVSSLLTSKIGVGILGRNTVITTPIFQFIYRTDENAYPGNTPFIDLPRPESLRFS